MDLKGRIKEVRLAVGIPQIKFAERIAISTSYISEIENGIKEPNERVLRLIISEYNINENWLRHGQGTMFNEDMSAKVSEAMGLFKSLDGHFQDGALKMLETLSEINSATKTALP